MWQINNMLRKFAHRHRFDYCRKPHAETIGERHDNRRSCCTVHCRAVTVTAMDVSGEGEDHIKTWQG